MCIIKNKNFQKIGRDNNGLIAGRDIYYIVNDFKKNMKYSSPIYLQNSIDNSYTEEYRNYINTFKELEDYIYGLIFQKNKKKYEFKSNYLIFAKSLLDWIMGIGDFPLEKYKIFCDELKRIYKIDENDVLLQRWKAFGNFFSSNILEAVSVYKEILKNIESLECTPFILDDILIDGRNILCEYEQLNNKLLLDNPFQVEINKHNRKLTMPIYDRLKADCYEDTLKDIFTIEIQDENTITFGTRLSCILNEVQNLIFNTVFYGSITHMRLCRRVIANIMYSYSKIYEQEDFYKITLEMLALSGQYKEFKNLCLYLGDSLNFWYSNNYIEKIYGLMNKTLTYENVNYKKFIYGFYGKYLDDNKYNELEEDIYEYLRNIDNINFNITSEIFKSININVNRTSRVADLMDIFEKYISNKYNRFFHEIANILNNLDIEKLQDEVYKKYVKNVEDIIKRDKNINLNMAISKILKKNKYAKKFYKYKKNTAIRDLMELGEPIIDNYTFLLKMTNEYEKRYDTKEKEPLIIRNPDTTYSLSREFFEEVYKDENIVNFIKEKYLSLTLKILESDKQTNTFKLEQLKNLLYIVSIENYANFKDIINCEINNIKFGYGKENQIINCLNYKEIKNDEIQLYIKLIKSFINQDVDFNELVTTYIEDYLKNTFSIELIIDCLKVIGISKRNNENILNQIYFLYLIMLTNNQSTKKQAIELISIFPNTKYEDKILKNIEVLSIDCTYDIARKILENLKMYEYEKINPILNILKKNMNINVRLMTENYEINIL